MLSASKWALIHAYRRLVEAGEAHPITCPDCDFAFVTIIGKDDEPVFKCYQCRSVITPGLAVWNQIEKAVNV